MNNAPKQIDKFREAARKLGIDQSDEAFETAVTKIAHAAKLSDEEIKKLAQQHRQEAKR